MPLTGAVAPIRSPVTALDPRNAPGRQGGRSVPGNGATGRGEAPARGTEAAGKGQAAKAETRREEARKQEVIRTLRQGEQEVRAHEQAHKAAAGPWGGAMSFSYASGPDGRLYVVGGEVAIDTSRETSPKATLTKMQTVQRAALAPAEPSSQDRAVAARAAAEAAQAAMDVLQEQVEKATASREAVRALQEVQEEKEARAKEAREAEEKAQAREEALARSTEPISLPAWPEIDLPPIFEGLDPLLVKTYEATGLFANPIPLVAAWA